MAKGIKGSGPTVNKHGTAVIGEKAPRPRRPRANPETAVLPLVDVPARDTVAVDEIPADSVVAEENPDFTAGERDGLVERAELLSSELVGRDSTIEDLRAEIAGLRRTISELEAEGNHGGIQFAALKAAATLLLFPNGISKKRTGEIRQIIVHAPNTPMDADILRATIWLIQEAYKKELLDDFPEAGQV